LQTETINNTDIFIFVVKWSGLVDVWKLTNVIKEFSEKVT